MKKGLIYIAMLLIAVGCSKSEFSEYDAPSIGGAAAQDENAINFMAANNWGDDEEGCKTKGAVIENSSFNFGIFAYYKTAAADAFGAVPNFMNKQKVTKNPAGQWTYSPVKYWSNNDDDEFKFIAYAPYNDNTTIKGETLTYNLPQHSYDQVDFSTAAIETRTIGSTPNAPVDFQFEHQMAQINFTMKYVQGFSDEVTVNSITLKNMPYQKVFSYSTGKWENPAGSVAKRDVIAKSRQGNGIVVKHNKTKYLTGNDVSSNDWRLFLFPQASQTITIVVKYTMFNAVITKEIQKTIALEKNKVNTLNLVIDSDDCLLYYKNRITGKGKTSFTKIADNKNYNFIGIIYDVKKGIGRVVKEIVPGGDVKWSDDNGAYIKLVDLKITDENNGRVNMRRCYSHYPDWILPKKISGDTYLAAFAAVHNALNKSKDKDKDYTKIEDTWYLPALNEIISLFERINQVNIAMDEAKYSRIEKTEEGKGAFWTSTLDPYYTLLGGGADAHCLFYENGVITTALRDRDNSFTLLPIMQVGLGNLE